MNAKLKENSKNAISFIKAGLTTLGAVVAFGQMTHLEIEKIKAGF